MLRVCEDVHIGSGVAAQSQEVGHDS
eukprot:COSAG06_NODE_33068_length_495_cov_16.058081_1_plen_25_part_01